MERDVRVNTGAVVGVINEDADKTEKKEEEEKKGEINSVSRFLQRRKEGKASCYVSREEEDERRRSSDRGLCKSQTRDVLVGEETLSHVTEQNRTQNRTTGKES